MKTGNKVILVVVMALVLLFGVGQFFATNINVPSPGGPSSASSTPAPAAPVTRVVAYTPGPVATTTPTHQGSCWTNSIAAPFRPDAWRCTVGNSISDPCFVIPGSTSTLLCGANPAKANATSEFILKLTKPLPPVQPLGGPIPANWAWLIKLHGGTLCTPFTGTLPVTADHEAASYGCGPGTLGKDEMIFGDLNASSDPWTATVGTLSVSKIATASLPEIAASTTVSIDEIWQ